MSAPSTPANAAAPRNPDNAAAPSTPANPAAPDTSHPSASNSPDSLARQAFDVAVIGGGVAGLAASVALARSLRSVVVIDSGQPRNAPSAHAHNVLGQEGINPRELIAKGRAEAEGYGVSFIDATVTHAHAADPNGASAVPNGATDNLPGSTIEDSDHPAEAAPSHRFELTTSAGVVIAARRVIIATGLSDALPDIPGLAAEWGETVLHCPYCHGYEVRGQRIGIIGTTAMSYHQAMLFSQLSDTVTFVRHNAAAPDAQQSEMLEKLDIEYVDAAITEVARTDSETIVSVGAAGPTHTASAAHELVFDALAVGTYARANAELFSQLGGEVIDHPSGMGSFIPTQMAGQTDVPGVWAVGNSADMSAMVVASTASGVLAGAHVNADLIMEKLG
ncbi:NAD(P)/FAD-dependent oxidoreductase [Brevibacterium spongiae]|uniref:NAD(P)/FAD-dependent oxidoreductase n=1 Tax=Brevibacterium spongiae TaxID=2909672 RepID=A0ABY5SR29_9MICO|nr:NAD(P)/FAD-dependent oxidoreductase [Brevibacterium spongiae]UVI35529.1 NAD(P)/FAD-dependent oxidoreductase [Brevibacterium spongiae]